MKRRTDVFQVRRYGDPFRGKNWMIAGTLLVVLGSISVMLAAWTFISNEAPFHNPYIPGVSGVALVVTGFLVFSVGRLIHWYYWR